MKKLITFVFTFLGMITMTSCNKETLYKKSEFFPNDILIEQLIEDMPTPDGELIYSKAQGFASARVYVNSNDSAENYAQKVLDYLKIQNFKFIYTADDVYTHIGLVPAKEDSFLVKEFDSLDDCYFRDSWYFIYGNDTETYPNDYGTIFLKNEHVIRIKKESGVLEYEKESINFNYDYQIVINESPVNVTYIGN